MKVELPICIPPIETYQGISFVQGIILSHENIKNAYFNNYINCSCNDDYFFGELSYTFNNVLWEDFRQAGIAEMDLFHLKNIAMDKFVDFIRERIDQGNYIMMYRLDEYYLSYSEYYGVEHYEHDAYIYGYTDESFLVMAYHQKKLCTLEVPVEEIVASIYCYMACDPEVDFCSFRPYHTTNIAVDYRHIEEEVKAYLQGLGTEETGRVNGVKVYDVLQNCLGYIQSGEVADEDKLVEPKVFRMFWEHKKMLKVHVEKLRDIKALSEGISADLSTIENLSHRLFMLVLKYNATFEVKILESISRYLKEIREQEEKALNAVLRELQE